MVWKINISAGGDIVHFVFHKTGQYLYLYAERFLHHIRDHCFQTFAASSYYSRFTYFLFFQQTGNYSRLPFSPFLKINTALSVPQKDIVLI